MKRSILVVFILVLIATFSPAVFASLMDFSVVWIVENAAQSRIEILKYDTPEAWDSFALDGTTKVKDLDVVNDTFLASVCRVRFSSNQGGLHKVRFSSTPLSDNTNSYGYNLALSCDGSIEFLEIPDNASNSVQISFYLPYTPGFSFMDIFMDAVLTSLDSMMIGSYSATVTITVEDDT